MIERFSQTSNEPELNPSSSWNPVKEAKYPYSSIGLLNFKFGGKPAFGTGCLIRPNIVLTCAHNLYDDKEGRCTDLQFIPEFRDGYGRKYPALKFAYPKSYEVVGNKNRTEDDFGIVILEEDLLEGHGYLGIDTQKENLNEKEDVQICGYVLYEG